MARKTMNTPAWMNTSCRNLSAKTMTSCTSSSTKSSTSSSDSSTHMLIPGRMGFQSAHALVNRERVFRGRESLQRNVQLDQICLLQAEFMADQGELSFAAETLPELRALLGSYKVGEIIQRGPSVMDMHQESMKNRDRSAYKKILNRKFVEFGVGTARGKHDGRLYMVQLFRGPPSSEPQSKDDNHIALSKD